MQGAPAKFISPPAGVAMLMRPVTPPMPLSRLSESFYHGRAGFFTDDATSNIFGRARRPQHDEPLIVICRGSDYCYARQDAASLAMPSLMSTKLFRRLVDDSGSSRRWRYRRHFAA